MSKFKVCYCHELVMVGKVSFRNVRFSTTIAVESTDTGRCIRHNFQTATRDKSNMALFAKQTTTTKVGSVFRSVSEC